MWALELHIGNHGLVAHLCTRSSQEEPDPCAKRRGDGWGRKGPNWEEPSSRAERRGEERRQIFRVLISTLE